MFGVPGVGPAGVWKVRGAEVQRCLFDGSAACTAGKVLREAVNSRQVRFGSCGPG